jgi:hypothetical protein
VPLTRGVISRGKRMCSRDHIITLLAIVLIISLYSASCVTSQSFCQPPSKTPVSLKGQSIRAGKYRLTLVATDGKKKGAYTNGDLLLIPTSHDDVSLKTGLHALTDEDLSCFPLYGSVNINLKAVDAHAYISGAMDPIYPDVLVQAIGSPAVLIGTPQNRRDREIIMGEGGIVLEVSEITNNDFSGRWSCWGRGSGYFCAVFISEK